MNRGISEDTASGAAPLRVVHIITGLYVGGAEVSLCRLLEGTDPARIEAAVIPMRPGGGLEERLRQKGIAVYPLSMEKGRPTLRGIWQLARLLRKLRPDLVHGWLYQGNLAALAGRFLAGRRVPLIWSIRHSLENLAGERFRIAGAIRLGRYFSEQADCIVYNSTRSAAQHGAFGFRPARSEVIANGFDSGEFAPAPEARVRLRRELGLSPEGVVIGLAARFHPVKGHFHFLAAAARLLASEAEVRFVLAGTGIDSDNAELRAMLEAAGVSSRVVLAGERQDMSHFWNVIDIATVSSLAEGFPNALGEAMACAIPCVTTDVGDAAQLVGATGRVVPAGDADALATAWLELVHLGPEGRRQLGAAARDRIETHFSQAATAARYAELYRQLAVPAPPREE